MSRQRARAAAPAAEYPEHAGDDGAALVALARRRRPRAPAAVPGRRPEPPMEPISGPQAPLPSQVAAERRSGRWGWGLLAACIGLVVLTLTAAGRAPAVPPVQGITVSWASGVQVPERTWQAWIAGFPERAQLVAANDWLLGRLRDYLAALPAVAEVPQVALVTRPAGGRLVQVTLRLEDPVLPVRYADGRLGFASAAGALLPPDVTPPRGRPPLLSGIEGAGASGLQAAIDLWMGISAQVEPGLIVHLDASADLDDGTHHRGLVAHTRGGGRIIWGRPGDARYGIAPDEQRARLVATLRRRGDPGPGQSLNLRFGQPFLTFAR
jgi:hypothetical protein